LNVESFTGVFRESRVWVKEKNTVHHRMEGFFLRKRVEGHDDFFKKMLGEAVEGKFVMSHVCFSL